MCKFQVDLEYLTETGQFTATFLMENGGLINLITFDEFSQTQRCDSMVGVALKGVPVGVVPLGVERQAHGIMMEVMHDAGVRFDG